MSNQKRMVLAGGSGQVGGILARHFHRQGYEVVVLSRQPYSAPWQVAAWDGKTLGPWRKTLEGADVLVNLTGRSVNCRYTDENKRMIKESRVQSTRILGEAIAQLAHPLRLWMNASTATIYRHSFDRAMDEDTGEIGGHEPEKDAPESWRFSIEVATSWEEAFFSAATPKTRKIALRSALTMSPERGGIFDELLRILRLGLGGAAASGRQYVSWIHDADFVRAIEFFIAQEECSGPFNLAAPNPVPNRDFMKALRQAWGISLGLPANRWMLEVGAVFLGTETELLLKSRRVIPGRLLESGFHFQFPDWPVAARDLVARWREAQP